MRPSNLLQFVHTPLFDESLADANVGDAELSALQQALQANPEAGDVIQGTGGARKVRVGTKGRGKRGGARVIYCYRSSEGTIYLLLAYGKSGADDLSAAGKKLLKTIIGEL